MNLVCSFAIYPIFLLFNCFKLLLLLSANIQSEKNIWKLWSELNYFILDILWKYSRESYHSWLSSGRTGTLVTNLWYQVHLMGLYTGVALLLIYYMYISSTVLFYSLCPNSQINLFKDLIQNLEIKFNLSNHLQIEILYYCGSDHFDIFPFTESYDLR